MSVAGSDTVSTVAADVGVVDLFDDEPCDAYTVFRTYTYTDVLLGTYDPEVYCAVDKNHRDLTKRPPSIRRHGVAYRSQTDVYVGMHRELGVNDDEIRHLSRAGCKESLVGTFSNLANPWHPYPEEVDARLEEWGYDVGEHSFEEFVRLKFPQWSTERVYWEAYRQVEADMYHPYYRLDIRRIDMPQSEDDTDPHRWELAQVVIPVEVMRTLEYDWRLIQRYREFKSVYPWTPPGHAYPRNEYEEDQLRMRMIWQFHYRRQALMNAERQKRYRDRHEDEIKRRRRKV